MSGGHFIYSSHRLVDIIEEIESIIENNDNDELDNWGVRIGYGYSENTLDRFKVAIFFIKAASIYINRVDYLLSGDDSEESFHKRLIDEVEKLKFTGQTKSPL